MNYVTPQNTTDQGKSGVVNLFVNQRRQGEVIEQVCEVFPHVGIAILPQALVIEAVHLSDLSALVVPPQYCDAFLVPHLWSIRKY